MKKLFALILVLALCFTASAATVSDIGTIDDFSVDMPDGSTFTLSEVLAEKGCVVINIWATWCPWCVKEFPYMEEAYATYADKLGLICLSAYDDNDAITSFMAENELTTLPLASDTAGITDKVVKEGYPTTIALDRDGKCIWYHCGAMLSTDDFTDMFEKLVQYTAENAETTETAADTAA